MTKTVLELVARKLIASGLLIFCPTLFLSFFILIQVIVLLIFFCAYKS
jgi:hypothetical protein